MDLAVEYSNDAFDFIVEKNDLKTEDGLRSSVVISLFTDQRVDREELPLGENDKGGFWGDTQNEIPNDKTGSKLWLLRREKAVDSLPARARQYCLEALEWMLEDGVASAVDVSVEYLDKVTLGIKISIQRPQGNRSYAFKYNWDAELGRII